MKILITGINGFVGGQFLKFLNKKNIKCDGVVRSKSNTKNIVKNLKIKSKLINIYEADLIKKKDTKVLINKTKPDIIFHFAGVTRGSEKNNDHKITKNLISSMSNKSILVFPSTDKVYINDPKKNKETSKIVDHFDNCYEKNKFISEKLIIKKLIKFYILRLGPVHSTSNLSLFKNKNLIDKLLNNLKNKKKVLVFSNVYRSFCRVEELSLFFYNLVYKKKIPFGIYNIGSNLVSYHDRLIKLARSMKISTKKIIPKFGIIEPKKQELDTNKIRRQGFIFT